MKRIKSMLINLFLYYQKYNLYFKLNIRRYYCTYLKYQVINGI